MTIACLCSSLCFAQQVQFVTLGYHEVRDNLAINYDPDRYAVTSENLAGHFRWLKSRGYSVINVNQILAAQNGEKPLPEKAVLLSFDDGFVSVYTHVFPLLKTFGYSAIVSPVTSWIENEKSIEYAGEELTKDSFLTWDQMRQMQASGLVEIASHSHNLHRGIPGNPQGNEQPAAVTLAINDGVYETVAKYKARVREDLETSAQLIKSRLGKTPRVITWPYGAWNQVSKEAASDLGMQLSLTLNRERSIAEDGVIGRDMLVSNPGVRLFAEMVVRPPSATPVRSVQVDLDYVYDLDPIRQEANLGLLLDRIKAMQISHVFLQAFADPDGDGSADALYYPNRHLPMRADLFNRAAWQLRTRAGVEVFAWMPVTAFVVSRPTWQVLQQRDGKFFPDPDAEPRLSVFVPQAREWIQDLYEDLGQYTKISGIHFHDDARLNEFEDANPAAIDAFSTHLNKTFSVEQANNNPLLSARWGQFKSQALTHFSLELAEAVRYWQPGLKTSRNLFANALLQPDGESYLAQNFQDFLASYDLVSLMAMPKFENITNETQFYENLVNRVRAEPTGLKKTIFQLQAVDWSIPQPIPATELRQTMVMLKTKGVDNLAYYPDDFIRGVPELEQIIHGMSLAETPWGPAQ